MEVVQGRFNVLFRFVSGIAVTAFPLPFFLGGGGGVVLGAIYISPRGDWLEVEISCTCVKKPYDVRRWLGGVRYQTGRPNIKPMRLRVTMTSVRMIADGGKKNIIC